MKKGYPGIKQKVLLISIVILVGLLPLTAQIENDQEAYKEARRAIYEKDWTKATRMLKTFKQECPWSDYIDDALYWLAYCLNKKSEGDPGAENNHSLKKEALENLDYLVKRYGKGAWADDAKLLRVKLYLSLAKAGHKKYGKIILRIAKNHGEKDKELRLVALDALAQLDPEKAGPILESIISGDEHNELWERAVLILNRSQNRLSPEIKEPLLLSPREKPKTLYIPPVKYPMAAINARVQGKVVLKVTIDREGKVKKADLFSGHPLLNSTALKLVKKYKYQPYILKGKALSVTFYETTEFVLKK